VLDGVVAAGSSLLAGSEVGFAASSLSLGTGDFTGTAGVLGCGCSVAAAGSSVVSVVTCVTGAASGLTGGGTSVTVTGTATGCAAGAGLSAGCVFAALPALERCRPGWWATAVTEASVWGLGLTG
jgi:hypothetical protein